MKKPCKVLTPAEEETLHRRTVAATERLDAWLKDDGEGTVWEDARVLSLQRQDALDDLNDAIRRLERNLALQGVRVTTVPADLGPRREKYTLLWNGARFMVVDLDGDAESWLTSAGVEVRLRAVEHLRKFLA